MKTDKVRATLTTGKDREHLTLRLWLSQEQLNEFVLQTGKSPKGLFNVIVMDGD